MLEERQGTTLNEVVDGSTGKPGSWCPVGNVSPATVSGRIRPHLATMAQAERMAKELHGQAINVGADLIAIEVSNDVLDAATPSGNGTRGRGRWGPAPAI